jgi:hypothetical protein
MSVESKPASLWDRITPEPGSRPWRRFPAWLLLVLGCIVLPIAVTGAWARGTIYSTDGFVNALGPIASEPAVQEAIATNLTDQIFERLALEERLQDAFPDRLGFLATPVVNQLEDWTNQLTLRLVESDEFPAIWTAALGAVHSTVVDFMNGSGRVALGENGVIELDLSGLSTRIVDRLEQLGIEIPADERPILTSGKVPIAQVAALEQVRSILNFLKRLFIVLPILAVIFLAGSVAVAVKRQKATTRAGIGIMISMAIFLLILALARMNLFNAVEDAGMSTDVAGAIWGDLTIALRGTAWGLFFIGILLLIYPRVVSVLRGEGMSRAAERAVDAGWDTGAPGRWISSHKLALSLGVLIVGVLVLVLMGSPSLVAVIATAVVVIVVEASIFFLARQSDLMAQATAGVNDSTEAPEKGGTQTGR